MRRLLKQSELFLHDILFAYNCLATMPEGYEDDYRANEPFWKESYDWVLKKDRMWSKTIWFMTFDYPQSMQPDSLFVVLRKNPGRTKS
ncbi:MAG: hypothetical protein IKI01_03400 [Lachnospiraceae bacterium]|nr:hypothetical protein [Lachnospiraceae bacterium]